MKPPRPAALRRRTMFQPGLACPPRCCWPLPGARRQAPPPAPAARRAAGSSAVAMRSPSGLLEDGLVRIRAGQFRMGSPGSEIGRNEDEGPAHVVTVHAFALGRYPVTRAELCCSS